MDSLAKAEAAKLGMNVIDMSPLYYRTPDLFSDADAVQQRTIDYVL